MKVLVIASLAYSLVNFRGALLTRMASNGHEVVAVAPDDDPQVRDWLAERGIGFALVPMDRTGTNPLRDLRSLLAIRALLRRERPDMVLAYTQKPIIYGGLACRMVDPSIRFHAMITGLGHVYGAGGGWRRAVLRALTSFLYRLAVARARTIFTFNRDDGEELRRAGIIARDRRVVQLPGSGVDTGRFAQVPVPDGPPVFLLVARLMRDKGIGEFVEAARQLKRRFPAARFQLLGPLDSNPSGISAQEVVRWSSQGAIEYLGETRDVRPCLAGCHVFVLPSYYREGLPRTILEAMATGRPIITTDMPGCREPIEPGRNGVLVPPRDHRALAEAMARFLKHPDDVARMGGMARSIAVARYDVDIVNTALLRRIGMEGASNDSGPGLSARMATGDRVWLDRTLAGLAALLLAPVMLLAGLMVLIALGRPILFVQRRAGRDGRPFDMVKFRTMRDICDAAGRPLPDGQRLTPVGRLLRRTRIDELPELWNVWRGEMSLIGPRPLLPETVEAMGEAGRRRGTVRPGLTGWAQINGNTLLSTEEKLALDLWYVEHRSVALDARIILATLMTVARGENVNRANLTRAHARFADRCG